MRDNILPEEKLLKLIRINKKNNTSIVAAPNIDRSAKQTVRKFSFIAPHIGARKIIQGFYIGSLFYLTASLVYPLFDPKEIKMPDINAKEKPDRAKEVFIKKENIKPYEFYSSIFKQRKIFTNSGVNLEKPIGIASADLIKDINLVGIISGEVPQAIIEDKKAQKTYYLKKGQFMGPLQLADIQEGKIILNYEGQMYELYL